MKTAMTINPNTREFFAASSREARLDTLKNVGYIDGHRVVRSKRDKANDAKLQRKRKAWLNSD